MSTFFDRSRYMPCADCGASVAGPDRDDHVCEPERSLDFRLFQLRDELAAFGDQLDAYLGTPAGRFAQWYARRSRNDPSAGAAGEPS